MKTHINQTNLRQMNVAAVFACVQNGNGVTRKNIAELTDMSWGAVSTFTSELIEHGYIVEEKAASSANRGPIPSYLYVRDDVHVSLGLEINDMGLSASVVNLKHQAIATYSAPLELLSKEQILNEVYAFLDDVVEKVRAKYHILCIGVAMQGIVDFKNGISVRIPGRVPDWRDVPIASLIASHTEIPTYIAHDPDCVLYAADTCEPDTILVRVDRGVGMAVMMDGVMVQRPGVFELGHVVAVNGGIPCACGKCGCLDKYVSMRGIAARAGKKYKEVADLACKGDSEALSLFADAGKYLAEGICSAAHLLAIDRVLLCGALTEQKELFLAAFESVLSARDPEGRIKVTFVDTASASLGAALLAQRSELAEIDLEKQ